MFVLSNILFVVSLALIAAGTIFFAKNCVNQNKHSNVKQTVGASVAYIGCGLLIGLYLPIQLGSGSVSGEWIGFVLLIMVTLWSFVRTESAISSQSDSKRGRSVPALSIMLVSLIAGFSVVVLLRLL